MPAVDINYQSVLERTAVTVSNLIEAQNEMGYWDDITEMHSDVRLKLSKYTADTLTEVCGLVEEKPHLAYLIFDVMGDYTPDPMIRDFVHLQKVLDEGMEITQDGEREIREAIMALDYYPELPTVSKTGPYPMDRIPSASAVIEATCTMRWSNDFSRKAIDVKQIDQDGGLEIAVIADPDLAMMIIERPYEVHRILGLVQQRGEDIAMVKEILEAEVAAVSAGIL